MSLLTRYLLRQNMFLMILVLAVGIGLYLLSDLFDRLDDFLEAGIGLKTIILYFVAKTPLIVSQILPAVFLIGCILQLCFMARSRELVALQAGGISFARLARFFIVYGLIWAVVQLGFSQFLGVRGEDTASRIWREDVRKKSTEDAVLSSIWFTEGAYVVHLGTVQPARGQGANVTVYELNAQGTSILQVLQAARFTARKGEWMLHDVRILDPGMFATGKTDLMSLPLQQDVGAFKVIDPRMNLQKLPLWSLWGAIGQLKASGSNVEALWTALHMKLAYAGSVVVMGLIALMLATWKDNLYICLGVGLLLTFGYYALFTLGGTMGEKGIVPPVLAAWGADILFAVLAVGRILWFTRPRGTIRRVGAESRRRWVHGRRGQHPLVRHKMNPGTDQE